MSETQKTTNAIQKLVSSIIPLKTVLIIDDSDAYPYAVVDSNVTSIAAVNLGSNAIVITVSLDTGGPFVVNVPSGSNYQTEYESTITSIDVSGTLPDFSIELLRRSE